MIRHAVRLVEFLYLYRRKAAPQTNEQEEFFSLPTRFVLAPRRISQRLDALAAGVDARNDNLESCLSNFFDMRFLPKSV